jgi:hypothetical protein
MYLFFHDHCGYLFVPIFYQNMPWSLVGSPVASGRAKRKHCALSMKLEKGTSRKQLIAWYGAYTSTIYPHSRTIWIRGMIPVVETLLVISNITVRLSSSPHLPLQPNWLFNKEKDRSHVHIYLCLWRCMTHIEQTNRRDLECNAMWFIISLLLFLWNVSGLLPDHTTFHPREQSPLWEPQIYQIWNYV